MKSKNNNHFCKKGPVTKFKTYKKGKQILWDINILKKSARPSLKRTFASDSLARTELPRTADVFWLLKPHHSHPPHHPVAPGGVGFKQSQFPGFMLAYTREVGSEMAGGPGQVSSPCCSESQRWEWTFFLNLSLILCWLLLLPFGKQRNAEQWMTELRRHTGREYRAFYMLDEKTLFQEATSGSELEVKFEYLLLSQGNHLLSLQGSWHEDKLLRWTEVPNPHPWEKTALILLLGSHLSSSKCFTSFKTSFLPG